ncbi:MAG: DUF1064 domain-containing protein [Aminipila sp.]
MTRMTEQQLQELLKKRGVKVQSETPHKGQKQPETQKKKARTTISFAGYEFDSRAELIYYRDFCLPLEMTGEIIKCELHKEFELLPKCTLCGQNLRKKVYHPDFILHYRDGRVTVVEIKGEVIKKLQRDFNLRKHIFIEKYCVPNKWMFKQIKAEDLTQGKYDGK